MSENDYSLGLYQDQKGRWEMLVLLDAEGYADSRPLAQVPLGGQRTEDEAVAAAERMLARHRWERISEWVRSESRIGLLLGGEPTAGYRADGKPGKRRSYTLNNGLFGNCACPGAMLSQAPVPEGLAEHPIVAAHVATYGDVYLVQDTDMDPHRECEHCTVVVRLD